MQFKAMQSDFDEYEYKVVVHREGSSENNGNIRTEIYREFSFTDIFKTDDAVANIRKFMKETFIDKIPQDDEYWFKLSSPRNRQTFYDSTLYLLSDYFVEKAKEL